MLTAGLQVLATMRHHLEASPATWSPRLGGRTLLLLAPSLFLATHPTVSDRDKAYISGVYTGVHVGTALISVFLDFQLMMRKDPSLSLGNYLYKRFLFPMLLQVTIMNQTAEEDELTG